jgi:hypothetical protein
MGTWAAVSGYYSVIVVVIVGQDVDWVFIARMVLMDQWHVSDGIGCCDVV